MFKFRSGIHGLNEELGRQEGRKECLLCGDECQSVSHVLWLPIISVEVISQLSYRIFLGKGFRISSLLIVRESLPLCWAVNCGRKTFHHSLSLLIKGYVLRILELSCIYDNPNVQQSRLRVHLEYILPGVTTGLGKYEGLCGKAGMCTSINSFTVFICQAPPSVLGAWSMALVLWL